MAGHSGLHYNTLFQQLQAPALHSAAFTSASLDLQNYDMAELIADIGTDADTLSGTVRIELAVQESNDNSTWTAAADASITTPVTGGVATGTFAILISNASLPGVFFVGYIGNARYIRLQVNFVSATTGGIVGVIGLAGRPKMAQVNT